MTDLEIGQLVKKKYPQYQAVDDTILGKRIREVHPEYSQGKYADAVQTAQGSLSPAPATPPPAASMGAGEQLGGIAARGLMKAGDAMSAGGRGLLKLAGIAATPFTRTGATWGAGIDAVTNPENVLSVEEANTIPKMFRPYGSIREGLGGALQIGATVGSAASTLTGLAAKAAATGVPGYVTGATLGGATLGTYGLGSGLQTSGEKNLSPLATVGETAMSGIKNAVGGMVSGAVGGAASDLWNGKNPFGYASAKKAIENATAKSLKPSVASVRKLGGIKGYYEDADTAFKLIKQADTQFPDATGEMVKRDPQNRAEFFDALQQTKNQIYNKYHAEAVAAGEKGAAFETKPVIDRITELSNDLKFSPSIRAHAKSLIPEISELQNAAPEIIEARMKELNLAAGKIFAGGTRADLAKAQVDASVAALMRNQLDDSITATKNYLVFENGQMKKVQPESTYQILRDQYASLKSIEKDASLQAAIALRKNVKGLPDFIDVFTGHDLVHGIVTANPVSFLQGATGLGIKSYYKWLNNPDQYISAAFRALSIPGAVPSVIVPRFTRLRTK